MVKMKKVIKLTEADLTNLVRKVIKENQEMEIQQMTADFNQKVGENLSPDDFENMVACANPDQPVEVDLSSIPAEEKGDAQQKVNQLQEKMKTASLKDLMQLRKQFREYKKQQRQLKNEQILSIPTAGAIGAGQSAVFLGITMSPLLAVACAMALGGLLLFLISRLLFPRVKTIRSSCRRPKWHLM